MGRVLVAGSYPPVPSPAAKATLAAVRAAVAAGDDVTVVSPRPSAATYSGDLRGWRAPWTLWRVGRHCGARSLVVVAEPGLSMGPGTTGWPVLSAVFLRRFDEVRIEHADGPAPGGPSVRGPSEWQPGYRVWRAAATIETGSTRLAHALFGRHAPRLGAALRFVLRPVRNRIYRRLS